MYHRTTNSAIRKRCRDSSSSSRDTQQTRRTRRDAVTSPNNRRENGNVGQQISSRGARTDRDAVGSNINRQLWPIGWADMQQIGQRLENKQLLEGSHDLLDAVNTGPVLRRADDLWPEPAKQALFLRVLVATARATQEDISQMTQQFIHKVLDSTLLPKLVDSLTRARTSMPVNQQNSLVNSVLWLLLIGWQTFPTMMGEKGLAVHSKLLLMTLRQKQPPNADAVEEETRRTLMDKLEMAMQNIAEPERNRNGHGLMSGDAQQENQQQRRSMQGRRQTVDSSGEPPEDFRTVSNKLDRADMLTENWNVYLRKAVVLGRYQSDEHYLDVQFRLLREDLCRPLRDGIRQARQQSGSADSRHSLMVYRGVRKLGTDLCRQSGELLVYVQLNERDRQRRFMFGSLVCLSSDAFERNFRFGMVGDSVVPGGQQIHQKTKAQKLFDEKYAGAIGIQLWDNNGGQPDVAGEENQQQPQPEDLGPGELWMLESPAFYESYRHVLQALQNILPGQPVPLSRYLVSLESQPALPRYQQQVEGGGEQQQQHALFDFDTLLIGGGGPQQTHLCSSQQMATHFRPEHFAMDRSQFEAFAYALRSELAVVQGPPGTGKTWLGLKIVQLLLANDNLWAKEDEEEEQPPQEEQPPRRERFRRRNDQQHPVRRPMLVVCYTNHALDQFLEGILQFLPSGIVRVGGRSQSEKLKEFNITQLRSSRWKGDSWFEFRACREALKRLSQQMEKCDKEIAIVGREPDGWPATALVVDQLEAIVAQDELNDAFTSQLFRERSTVVRWLTAAKQSTNSISNTLSLVHKLVDGGIPEELAREVTYLREHAKICQPYKELDSGRWHRRNMGQIGQQIRQNYQSQLRDPQAQTLMAQWPMLAHIQLLMERYGTKDVVAIELLASLVSVPSSEERHQREQKQRERDRQLRAIHQLLDDLSRQKAEKGGQKQQRENKPHQEMCANANQEQHQQQQREEAMGFLEQQRQQSEEDFGDDRDRRLQIDEDFIEDLLDRAVGDDDEEDDPTFRPNDEKQTQKWIAHFLAPIAAAVPMPDAEMSALREQHQEDPWALPLIDRWRLWRRWLHKWVLHKRQERETLQREYGQKKRLFDELRSRGDIEVMKRCKVIGMTTSGAARLQAAIRSVKPRIVVVEEAAEVFEAHIVTSLTECCEHLILIGDHQQLRPSPQDYQLARDYNLEISLFERLVLNTFDYRRLDSQHRMRPEISRTLMPHFYRGLNDHPSVAAYPNVLGMQKNMFFLVHSRREDQRRERRHQQQQREDSSHFNEFEAEFMVKFAGYLLRQGYGHKRITLLCAYADQFLLVKEMMNEHFRDGERPCVENVDNYQGEECDIILLSLVRSNNPNRRIGFLKIPNRVCVALSRAKHGLFVFANLDFLATNCSSERCKAPEPGLWENIRQSVLSGGFYGTALPIQCQMHGTNQEISLPSEFGRKSPEGGCQRLCGYRMDCGHVCRKACHPDDLEHNNVKCMEPCERRCPNGGHPCPDQYCYQKCADCRILVQKILSCGHLKEKAYCYRPVDTIVCDQPCTHILACGHPCKEPCSQPHTEKCQVPVTKRLPCGHLMAMPCHQQPDSFKCNVDVEKRWPHCEHSVRTKCHVDPAVEECPAPCGAELADCGHKCTGTCGKCKNGRLHVECGRNCNRILVCGHQCRDKCSVTCPPCQKPCETACPHSQCSQVTQKGEHQRKERKTLALGDKQQPKSGRLCGQTCPQCAEPCANACEHRQCTLSCGEPCNVEPCDQPCRKPLKCFETSKKEKKVKFTVKRRKLENRPYEESYRYSEEPTEAEDENAHRCAGMCGEECIQICRKCQPEEFARELGEQLFGTEEEPNARFIRLKDCGHTVEVTAMDAWVRQCLHGSLSDTVAEDHPQESTNNVGDNGTASTEAAPAIIQISCPRCKTPIRRSKRYIALLNQRAEDIEKIKRKILGSKSRRELSEEWERFKRDTFSNICSSSSSYTRSDRSLSYFYEKMREVKSALSTLDGRTVTESWLITADNVARLMFKIDESAKQIVDFFETTSPKLFTDEVIPTPNASRNNGSTALSTILYSGKAPLVHRGHREDLAQHLQRDLLSLVECLADRKLRTISDSTLNQMASELARNQFLFNLFKTLAKLSQSHVDITSAGAQSLLRSMLYSAMSAVPFKEQKDMLEKQFADFLAAVGTRNIGGLEFTSGELVQINRALGGHVTNWYKCPRGHVYGIGECGQAMQHAKCPECQAGNIQAPEMRAGLALEAGTTATSK